MTTEPTKPRFYTPTPGKMIAGLLIIELCLFTADSLSLFGMERGSGWNVIWAIGIFFAVIVGGLVWFVVALVFRRKFQFSILSLISLMCVVAVVAGWFGWKMERAKRQAAAVEAIDAVGSVAYDYERDEEGKWIRKPEPFGPSWLRKLLGIDFFAKVTFVRICQPPYLDLTDAQMEHFQNLPDLKHLWIRGVRTSAFHNLRGLTKLERLWLSHSTVTDTDLEHFEKMPQLGLLNLSHTQVTDAGLEELKGMAFLKILYFSDTQVTDQGIKELQRALPNCRIIHDFQ